MFRTKLYEKHCSLQTRKVKGFEITKVGECLFLTHGTLRICDLGVFGVGRSA